MRDFLHHFFIPRESNNHRAHFLHAESLLLLVSMLLVINFLTPHVEERYPQILGVSVNISISDLVNLTNQKRAEAGLAPLTLNDQLSQAANGKAQYMLAQNFWAHNAPDGTTPWVFFKNAGYDYVYAGENLARGFTNAPDAMAAWMASPGHRENIMSPNYKDIGFAVASGTLTGDETVLIVEMFGAKSGADLAVSSAQMAVIPPPTVLPTPTLVTLPSVLPTVAPTLIPSPLSFVAGVTNDPVIDRNTWFKTLSLIVIAIFLFIFVVDMVIIERRQIVRLVSHNIDHMLFLSLVLVLIMIFGNGVVL